MNRDAILSRVDMTKLAYVCKFCIYAKFAYVRKSGHVYAFTHLDAKFARMKKLEILHLPQTKCKSHFAYAQNLRICKSGHVNRKQNLHT